VHDGDELIEAKITDGNQDIILGTLAGKAIRFHEKYARPMGRSAAGVKGIQLEGENRVVGMVVVKREGTLLVVSEKGYGKRSEISDYRITHRGGKGIITLKTTIKVGRMIALMEVVDEDDLMIITAKGIVIRQSISQIRTLSRNTQGVRLIRIGEDDRISDVARVIRTEEEEENGINNLENNEKNHDLFG
jgi:DNA gyrase subunit A